MVVRVNGQVILPRPVEQQEVVVIKSGINPKLKTLAVNLWVMSGAFAGKAVHAATVEGGLWSEMSPLFALFQDVAMVLGVLAIMAGLIILVFKKRMGMNIVKTSSIVVAGVFLVPSAVLLIAIIGMYFNDALTDVLANMRGGDVPVGGM